MMQTLDDLNVSISILEGTVEVGDLGDFFEKLPFGDCSISLLNADFVADKEHAKFAAKKAIKAWRKKENIAKTLAMEVLLYASATRQINKAMKIGIKKNSKSNVVAVIIGKDVGECVRRFKDASGFNEEQVLIASEDKTKRLKRFFDIGKEEVQIVGVSRVPDIIKERIVMFDLFK